MIGIGWFKLFYLFILLTLVICYPSAPGTCNIELMGTIGHGPSHSTCDDCYQIIVQPNDPSISSTISSANVNIKVMGTPLYQGLMLLVKDQTNKTVGTFMDFDETIFAPVACDDEAIEEESVAVIGHLDPHVKTWPIQVGWSIGDDHPWGEFRVQGMVVIDYDNFHIIPEKSFILKQNPVTTHSNTTSSSTIKQWKPTATEVEIQEWPIDSYNPFFMHVVILLMSIYVSMSLILRYCLRRK
ncbi:uncharacterized protein BX664DRAFT_333640 [Halteromyces radiatus]|uniref:uncharacterized protein n=1 Tax=Halteromyces radiatus TaxID=101107 RepID=UPI00222026A7|nr:uncharacterized protein BX664DRAFT_333640 [Halteromyces radiatus]KAI8089683.1 hypothetical protein BX664DRAFT_333640 [Halteromyces radiatus]